MTYKLTLSQLKILIQGIAAAKGDEINCDQCWDKIDCFAEMELSGKDASQVLPLVEEHLERCGECREEYEALLKALKNITQ